MNTVFQPTSRHNRLVRLMCLFVGLLGMMALSGCPAKTTVSGIVVDSKGKPVANAQVVLGHTKKLNIVGKTDTKGKFSLRLREWCFPMCAGGNPSLRVDKQGYAPATTYAPWDKSTSHTIRLKPVKKR